MSVEQIRSDPELRACFDALPAAVQESIVQSGVKPATLRELQELAAHLQGKA